MLERKQILGTATGVGEQWLEHCWQLHDLQQKAAAHVKMASVSQFGKLSKESWPLLGKENLLSLKVMSLRCIFLKQTF